MDPGSLVQNEIGILDDVVFVSRGGVAKLFVLVNDSEVVREFQSFDRANF